MTTYTWPTTLIPTSSYMRPITNSKLNKSPLSGYIQTASRDGGKWLLELIFANLQTDERGELQGFLAQLDGQAHRIQIKNHAYTGARGALGGTPLVNGASQTGKSLISDGWPNSTEVLKRGDLVSFSNATNLELKMVTADSTSDGSGNLTIPIWPEIHTSPANNAAIDVTDPEGTFYLEDDVGWSNAPGALGSVVAPISGFDTIRLVEDIV